MYKQKKTNIVITLSLKDIKKLIKCNDSKELDAIIDKYEQIDEYKYKFNCKKYG